MKTADEVATTYRTFLDRAIRWLRNHAYSIDAKSNISHTQLSNDLVAVHLTAPIHCIDWPWSVGSSKKIHIVADCEDRICLRKQACIKTNLRVAYFLVDGGRIYATDSLHYDCEIPTDPQHPVCHVQCCNKVLIPLPALLTSKYGTPLADGLKGRCQTIRIPSAFVSFLSLFALLAADHLSKADWGDFMKEFGSIEGKYRLACGGHATSVRRQSLSAWAWYDWGQPTSCAQRPPSVKTCKPKECKLVSC